jgi:hypothetical protein
MMPPTIFRYVEHADVLAHLRLGWMVAPGLVHPVLGERAVLMSWPCVCPEPTAQLRQMTGGQRMRGASN